MRMEVEGEKGIPRFHLHSSGNGQGPGATALGVIQSWRGQLVIRGS